MVSTTVLHRPLDCNTPQTELNLLHTFHSCLQQGTSHPPSSLSWKLVLILTFSSPSLEWPLVLGTFYILSISWSPLNPNQYLLPVLTAMFIAGIYQILDEFLYLYHLRARSAVTWNSPWPLPLYSSLHLHISLSAPSRWHPLSPLSIPSLHCHHHGLSCSIHNLLSRLLMISLSVCLYSYSTPCISFSVTAAHNLSQI